MSDQVTDLRSTAATVRRHGRLLGAACVLGLAAGITNVLVQAPPLTSTTLILLPTPALADSSSSDVSTQIRIAESATILGKAGETFQPALPAQTVENMVDVSAPTNQLLEFDATSPHGAVAQRLSQAVADAYVAYVSDTAREVSSQALADLRTRKEDLEAQITQLQNEMAATTERQQEVDPDSEEGRREAQLLAGLRIEQADLSLQLDKVEDKIATAAPVGPATSASTSVLQPATVATGPSTLVRMLIWGLLGAFFSTVLAIIILLLTARHDRRLRLRDEIADAVGCPVLAGVRTRPQRTVAGWSTLLKSYEATPVEAWAFRQMLRGLVPAERKSESRAPGKVDHPASLTVVSLSGDGRGLAIGPQLAAFAASLGLTTRLVTAVGHHSAAALWAACNAERSSPPRPGLHIGAAPEGEAVDLTITLVVVDRRQPDLRDAPSTATTMLSVAAATATEQELARVAVAVDDAARHIDGIVVADPDRSDWTTGRHTMDERSRQMALPVRLTGVGQSGAARQANRIRR